MRITKMLSIKKALALAGSMLILSLGAIPVNAEALHYITQGDSLYRIAVNNGISVTDLKTANALRDNLIYPGKKLVIPDQPAEARASSIATAKPAGGRGDIDLLAKLVAAEAGSEPFKGKVAVAAVILNRTEDRKFPATITENIFKPHEFESVSNGLIWRQPVGDAHKAVSMALKGWDPTNGAKYFFNPGKAPGRAWVWTRTIIDRIGHHVFAV